MAKLTQQHHNSLGFSAPPDEVHSIHQRGPAMKKTICKAALRLAFLVLVAMPTHAIDIAFLITDNKAWILGVAISSIVDSAAPDDDLRFHVFSPDLSHDNQEKLRKCTGRYSRSLEFHRIVLADIPNLKSLKWHKITCAKCLIPDRLPRLDKILFLDADVVVRTSLAQLWEIDVSDRYAAVGQSQYAHTQGNLDYIRLQNKFHRFTSGVMLINAKKYRQDGMSVKFLHEMNEILPPGDDEVFSNIFDDKVVFLHPKWNVVPDTFTNYDQIKGYALHSAQEHLEAASNPAIVHFAALSYYDISHPYLFEFTHYLSRGPFVAEFLKYMEYLRSALAQRDELNLIDTGLLKIIFIKIKHLFGRT